MTLELKGKPVADQIREEVLREVEAWKARGIVPKLCTLIVEGDPASLYYAEAKGRAAEKLGIEYELHKFPATVSEGLLLDVIGRLNRDPEVHGIMLELPLPAHLHAPKIAEAILPQKDIDGLHPDNLLAAIKETTGLYPATPKACIALLTHYGHTVKGKHVVMVGRGATVGLPLMHLLLGAGATVTVCTSKTPDLSVHLKQADIAFVAVGRAGLIQPEMVHEGLILIDAGINETADGKIVGDVSADCLASSAGLSPTPGGVGTVTTAMLFRNMMDAMDLQIPVKEAR